MNGDRLIQGIILIAALICLVLWALDADGRGSERPGQISHCVAV